MRGFPTSQLIEYTLEPNTADSDDTKAPPEKLTFSFSTADVIVLGWRLDRITSYLRDNRVGGIGVLSKRYADMERGKPYVAFIMFKAVPDTLK